MKTSLLLAALLLPTSAALAQTEPATSVDPNPRRDTVTVGAGVGIVPDYEGSDDYRLIPAAQARGELSGFDFFTRGTALYVDLLREEPDATLDISLGPIAAIRLSRTARGSINDQAIRDLGKIDLPIELGGFVGVSKTGVVTSAFDVVSAQIAYQRDVAGSHDSYVLNPSLSYLTPLSTRNFVGLSGSMDFVGDGFARQYFGVTPGQSAASGLPAYDLDGGLKSYSLSLIGGQTLEGDIRAGFALFGIVSYSRLLGDFARSPVVTIDGSPNQWFGAIGVGYTF